MTRISRDYFPESSHLRSENMYYAGLFTRDLPLGLMPFRAALRDGAYSAKLVTQDAQLETDLRTFLHVGGYGGSNLSESMIEFVRDAAQYLGQYGEMYFEIAEETNSTSDPLSTKTLELFPRGKILHFPSVYVQLVPIKDWKKGEPRALFIPAKNVWHLKLPKKLGSPRKHRRLIKKLNYLSRQMPDFASEDGKLGASAHYDFSLDHKKKEIVAEYLTKKWGSIPSLRQIKGTTEYYYIVHSAQFSYSQALIREHIVAELNLILTRQGVQNTIKLEGLPYSKDIKEAIAKLQRGEIGFAQAIAATKVED